jgi:hypothetical protein
MTRSNAVGVEQCANSQAHYMYLCLLEQSSDADRIEVVAVLDARLHMKNCVTTEQLV